MLATFPFDELIARQLSVLCEDGSVARKDAPALGRNMGKRVLVDSLVSRTAKSTLLADGF